MTSPKPDAGALGMRLASARLRAGLTGTSVGLQLGYKAGKKTVSQWETGRAVPDALTLKSLCRLYQCSADTLLWSDNSEIPGVQTPLGTTTMQRISRLSEPQRNSLENMVRNILDMLEQGPGMAGAVSTADFAGKPPHAAPTAPLETPTFLKR